MTLLIIYILLALGVSFLCSIMEAVLLSVTPSYVAAREQEGVPTASTLKGLKDDIDRPLAAILSLNTIAHTVGAAGAGAQAAAVYGEASIAIFSALLTLAILFLSEIIPKTLGALHWRTLAPIVTRALVISMFLTWPLVYLSKMLTRLLSGGREKAGISREEITALADLGEQHGVFEDNESRILKNLFRFRSLRVKDVMTPRTVAFALPADKMIFEVLDEYNEFRFSRIPIYTESRDDIAGYVLKDDILLRAAQENDRLTLNDLKRDILVVPDNLPLPDLFERLLDGLEHISLVVDEYGGMAGIVTMEDVVETLLGMEIVDEVDSVEDMQELARQEWTRRARRLGLLSEDERPADVLPPPVPSATPPASSDASSDDESSSTSQSA